MNLINKIYWFFRPIYDKYLLKKDESLIPEGMYCYTIDNVTYREDGMPIRHMKKCPYWLRNSGKFHQENGYCAFFQDSDWGFNSSDDEFFNCKTGEKVKAKDLPFSPGILWDGCKSCEINEYDYELDIPEVLDFGGDNPDIYNPIIDPWKDIM